MTDTYLNLSQCDLSEEEKDFLCFCYLSDGNSPLGTTSKTGRGRERLTFAGIEQRYGIKEKKFRKWIKKYTSKLYGVPGMLHACLYEWVIV